MSWRYINSNESKQVNTSSLLILGLMSLIVIVPTVNQDIVNSIRIYGLSDAIDWSISEVFRSPEMVQRSQYLTIAAKIYELSRADSTLVVTNSLHALYVLTGLLPPVYALNDLDPLYSSLNSDKEKLIQVIKKYRPTIIVTPTINSIPKNDLDMLLTLIKLELVVLCQKI